MVDKNSRPVCFMYVGNLEAYQGIDLLLESFVLLHAQRPSDQLVIIGGTPADVENYRQRAAGLKIAAAVELRGAQPVARIAEFLREADILVSPRIKGTNTPMKIYSYLDSGKPIIATNLFTHTQVLTPEVAKLPAPEPAAFAAAMRELAEDPQLRQQLGQKGHELVRARYSPDAFRQSMDRLYTVVETEVARRSRQAGKHASHETR